MSEPLDLAALRRVAERCFTWRDRVVFEEAVTPAVVLELVRRVEEAEAGK